MKTDVVQGLFNLHKIFKVIKSCHDVKQFINAQKMFWNYQPFNPENKDVKSLTLKLREFSLEKQRQIILSKRKKYIQIENGLIKMT